jgi:hypothetical protein
MLMPYHVDDIRHVVNDWCRNNKFFPMPAEIIGAIKDRIKSRQRNTVQIPDNLRSFDEQAEINSRGIAAVRSALERAKQNKGGLL